MILNINRSFVSKFLILILLFQFRHFKETLSLLFQFYDSRGNQVFRSMYFTKWHNNIDTSDSFFLLFILNPLLFFCIGLSTTRRMYPEAQYKPVSLCRVLQAIRLVVVTVIALWGTIDSSWWPTHKNNLSHKQQMTDSTSYSCEINPLLPIEKKITSSNGVIHGTVIIFSSCWMTHKKNLDYKRLINWWPTAHFILAR